MTDTSAKMLYDEFDRQVEAECNITQEGIIIHEDGRLEVRPDILRANEETRQAQREKINKKKH